MRLGSGENYQQNVAAMHATLTLTVKKKLFSESVTMLRHASPYCDHFRIGAFWAGGKILPGSY